MIRTTCVKIKYLNILTVMIRENRKQIAKGTRRFSQCFIISIQQLLLFFFLKEPEQAGTGNYQKYLLLVINQFQ